MVQSVLIVGGGVIGSASALVLATAGCDVTLVERATLGGESSWAGAGLLSGLLPWDYPPGVMRLLDQSRALYPAWISGLSASGVDPEYRGSGLLVLGADANMQDAAQSWSRGNGERCEFLAARRMVPELARDAPSIWLPQVAQVRNPRLLRALQARLRQLSVRVVERTTLTEWRVDGCKVHGAQTTQGLFSAEAYVVAAGAWSAQVLGPWQAHLPVKPVRGQIVLLKDEPGRLPCMLYQDGRYLIPRADGHLLLGSTLEDVGFDKQVTTCAREDLLAWARGMLPWLAETPVVAHWAGLRPAAPDNVPIIARHPELENLYVNSGHFRYGVTLAPASAQALADLMLGRASAFDLAAFGWPPA